MEWFWIFAAVVAFIWIVGKANALGGARAYGGLTPEEQRKKMRRSWTSYVAGYQHATPGGHSRQDYYRRLEIGETVNIVRDASNRHDPNAVRVTSIRGEDLGFFPRDQAARMGPEIDRGRRFLGFVLEVKPAREDASKQVLIIEIGVPL